ncbi:MAG: extracellular solute-binding protein, partial [Dehalococcoidia bacterium]|nr:extracellular solute-binding protein [Dehalococcoidia bacterium]
MEDRSRINRRDFLRMAGLAGIVLAGSACAPAAVPPTAAPTKAPAVAAPATAAPAAATAKPAAPAAIKPEDARAQLYELAKKEGQVMAYSTGTSAEMESYRKVFAKAYPGITVNEYMGTGEQIAEKMLTEFKAGKVTCDFVLIPLEQWAVILKGGLAEKWDPPEKPNYPLEALDPGGFYVTEQTVLHVIEYNTQLISAADAPKSYEDLLKPVFKGKLGIEQSAYSWFAQRAQIWGKDKATEYLKKLAAQQPKFVSGHTTLADAVVSGEVPVAVNVYQHRVEQQKAKGAPVAWAADQPTGAEPNSTGIAKGAPHPNAGKLFLDWRLTEEGQNVTLKDLSRYPMRTGMAIPPALQVKVALPTMETALGTQSFG